MSDLQEVRRQLRMTRDADERRHREIVAALARIERQGAPTPVVTLTATTAGPLGQYEEHLRAVREERDALVEKLLASQARVRDLEEDQAHLVACNKKHAATIAAYQGRVDALAEECRRLGHTRDNQAETIAVCHRRLRELEAETARLGEAVTATVTAAETKTRELEAECGRWKRRYADLETAVLARGYSITWSLESDPEKPRVRLEPTF